MVPDKANILFIIAIIVFRENVQGTISVINEVSGNVERNIEDCNIRSNSDAIAVKK
jgi:hypothetical protein